MLDMLVIILFVEDFYSLSAVTIRLEYAVMKVEES
jgi:hypothetical protein